MKKEMWSNIEKLSELRSNYSCFDEREQPYYHALSLGIECIKALEQESILDKIRAEIKALWPEPTAKDVVDGNPTKDAIWETLAEVLQIIDKYKAESEDKE